MSRAQLTSTVEQSSGGAVPPYVGAKNFAINGGMDVWQRSTSSAASGSALTFAADRWGYFRGSYAAGLTVSRQATGDTTNLANIQYCARVQRDSSNAGTNVIYIGQNFETVNSIPFAGKTVAFSFYARAGANYSATSNALSANLISGTGTDQSFLAGFTGSATPASGTATLTTTWQRFVYTGTVASTATQLAIYFQFTPTGTAGANDYFEVTGVQVEIGSVATPFSRAGTTLQGELSLCQRYYFRKNSNASSPNATPNFGQVINYYPGYGIAWVDAPTPMRVPPTSVDYSNISWYTNGLSGTAIASCSLTSDWSNQYRGCVVITTLPSPASNNIYFLSGTGSSAGYIGFSAEL